MVAGPARRNHGNSVFAPLPLKQANNFPSSGSGMVFCHSLVLKTQWMRMLGNLCATVVSSLAGRYLNPIANPALTRRAFLYRACGTRILEIRSLRRFNIGGWTVRSLCRRPLT